MTRTKRTRPGASESEVTEQVLQAAAMLGLELKRRNVGGMTNAAGKYVAFNEPGDSDYYCILPDGDGRHCDIELKHEHFDPRKARGRERERFERQLAKLRAANAAGQVGLWVRTGEDFLRAMTYVMAGARVDIDQEGFCWLTDVPAEQPSDPIRSDRGPGEDR